MALRSTAAVTSSESLVRLPLCRLILVLQENSLNQLNQLFLTLTFAIEQTGLHTVFLSVLEDIENYRKKITLEGIERSFDGIVGFVNESKGYASADGSLNGGLQTLNPDKLIILINIIRVYKAFSIQQFKIKALVEKIRLLEFPSEIYEAAEKNLAVTNELMANQTYRKIVTEFDEMLDTLDVAKLAKQNGVIDSYKNNLAQHAQERDHIIKHVLTAISQRMEQCRSGYVSVNTDIMRLNGSIVHDVPRKRSRAEKWLKEVENELSILKARRKVVTSGESVALESDILQLTAKFKAKKSKYIRFQDSLMSWRDELLLKRKQYLESLEVQRADVIRETKEAVKTVSLLTPVPNSDMTFEIEKDNAFENIKRLDDLYNQTYMKLKRMELALNKSVEDINDFLKSSLHFNPSNRNIQFDGKWTETLSLLEAIFTTEIDLSQIALEPDNLEKIKLACNIPPNCIEAARKDGSIASEKECIQSDAQKYINCLSILSLHLENLLSQLRRFKVLKQALNQGVINEMLVLYKNAVAQQGLTVDTATQSISLFIQEINGFHPEFLDIDSTILDIFDDRQWIRLERIERQLAAVQCPAQQADVKVELPDHIVYPNRRPDKQGFFQRHAGFLAKTAVAATVIGLGVGVGLALGMIFAPFTLGISIPVAIGIGAGVTASIMGAGAVMALVSCTVSDAFIATTPRRRESVAPLLASTASMQRSMPVGRPRTSNPPDTLTAHLGAVEAALNLLEVPAASSTQMPHVATHIHSRGR